MSNGDPSDDEVGYKKPPQHSRFKPGYSGHKKAHASGHGNLGMALRRRLGKKIKVRRGETVHHESSARVLIEATIAAAAKGDLQAVELILGWAREFGLLQPIADEIHLPGNVVIVKPPDTPERWSARFEAACAKGEEHAEAFLREHAKVQWENERRRTARALAQRNPEELSASKTPSKSPGLP